MVAIDSGGAAMVRGEMPRLRFSDVSGHETAAPPTFCTEAAHEQLRSTDAWQSMPYVGIQPGVAEIPALEMRNCTLCHSTLCREVAP